MKKILPHRRLVTLALRALFANSLLFSGLLFSSLLFSTKAIARTYIVEMVAFTHVGDSVERWDFLSAQAIAKHDKINAIFALSKNLDSALNSPSRLNHLSHVYAAIDNSAAHRVLQTARWVQESANYPRSPLVRISNSDNSIKGAVRVYAPDLLFAEINLLFAPRNPLIFTPLISNSNATPSAAYYIDERRKMKLKEIHYFDHSKFGVVLIVVPI